MSHRNWVKRGSIIFAAGPIGANSACNSSNDRVVTRGTRIGRHLTNQRTDAVAMSVLDPFEVFEIEVWPLPQFQESNRANLASRQHLDALDAPPGSDRRHRD